MQALAAMARTLPTHRALSASRVHPRYAAFLARCPFALTPPTAARGAGR